MIMKKKLWSVMLVAGMLAAAGCRDTENDSQGSNELAQEVEGQVTGGTMGDDRTGINAAGSQVAMTPDQFAMDAAESGMLEVQLGNLAQKNSSSQQVKQFAQMMVKDHRAANEELKNMAKTSGMTLPTTPSQSGMNQFNTLTALRGAEFDRAYSQLMVESHQETIRKFQAFADGPNSTANAAVPATGAAATTGAGGRNRGDGVAGRENTATGAPGTTGSSTSGNAGTNAGTNQGTNTGTNQNTGTGTNMGTNTGNNQNTGTGTSGTTLGTNTGASNEQLRTWASQKLPVLRKHLEQAQQLQQQVGGTTSASNRTPDTRQ
jgi:putative membrane protein